MYCKKCGRQVDNDANFCPNCGCNLIESNINKEDPRSFNKDLFHTSFMNKTINDVINNDPLLNKKSSKLDDVLSTFNNISSLISLLAVIIFLSFIYFAINYKERNYALIYSTLIPIIVCSCISFIIGIYFLVKAIISKSKLFRMLPLRIISLILTLTTIVLLSISLTQIHEENLPIMFYISTAGSIFSITMSLSTSSIDKKKMIKMFLNK